MVRKHHTRRSMKRHAKKSHRRVRKMRGGEAPVGEPYVTGNLVLPQGMNFRGMTHTGGDSPFYGVKPVHAMQQGGVAPYPGSGRFDGGLAQAAGTASLDNALKEVAGLRDPNQMGGRKRKSRKTHRKSHRKSQRKSHRKSQRKSHRKSKKSHRKSKKSHRKSYRKSKKSHRKSKKSQRGGEMELAESYKGGIIGGDLLQKAGLHPSWKSVEAGNMF